MNAGLPRRKSRDTGPAIALARRLAEAESALHAFTGGQLDAVVGPGGDAYLLRPAQEHLCKNEARLQALFDQNPDVITVLSEEGEVLCQSPAVTRVLGYEVGMLIGLRVFTLVHPDDLLGFCGAFAEALQATSPTVTIEFRHKAHDGSWRLLEATFGGMYPSKAEEVIVTFRDATSRRQAHDESIQREAASALASLDTRRFLAVLSHELRTPLMPALLGVELLERDEQFVQARPTLSMVRRNIELQSRLIEELVDFVALGQRKLRLRLETIDAHDAVRLVVKICEGQLTEGNIAVRLDLAARESLVRADFLRLQQVMWNLLKNAIKFSPSGGRIYITSANDSPGRIVIEFADEGVGIAPELLPLVFDPFQQGDIGLQQLHGGLGLGLFIAKGMAEAQRGTLTVASEGRNRGATFRLDLETASQIEPEIADE